MQTYKITLERGDIYFVSVGKNKSTYKEFIKQYPECFGADILNIEKYDGGMAEKVRANSS